MATVLDPNQKDKNQQGQTAAPQANPIATGAGSAVQAATPGTGNNQSISNNAPGASGRFTNIQKYIQANDPNAFAQQLGGKVGEVKSKAESDLQNAQTGFNTQKTGVQDTIHSYQDKVNDTIKNLSPQANQATFDQGVADLTAAKGLKYTGPQSLGNDQALTGQAQDLQSVGQATGSSGGRQALLERFYNTPQYSTGQKNLDNLLLGSQKNALSDIKRGASRFGGELTQAQQGAMNDISGLRNDITGVNSQATTAAGNLANSESQYLSDAAKNYIKNQQNVVGSYDKGYTGTANDIGYTANHLDNGNVIGANANFGSSNYTLDPETLKKLGAVSYTGDAGVDINKNFEDMSAADQKALLGRVDTAGASRFNTLNSLAGQTNNLAIGDQLKGGSANVDQSKIDNFNQAYTKALQDELNKASSSGYTTVGQQLQNSTGGGISAQGQAWGTELQKQLEQKAKKAALNNLFGIQDSDQVTNMQNSGQMFAGPQNTRIT